MPRKMSYKEMREKGLCKTCGKKNPTLEYSECPDCRQKRKEHRKENRQYLIKIGMCSRCGKNKAEPHKKMCYECLGKDKDYYRASDKTKKIERDKENLKKAIESGKCRSCKSKKAVYGVFCPSCYRKQIMYRQRGKNGIDRSERVSYGLCYICGKPVLSGKGVCSDCYKTRVRCIQIAAESPNRDDYFRRLNNEFWSRKLLS